MSTFPRNLLNKDALDILVDILEEKNAERRTAKGKLGPRVKNIQQAEEILSIIKERSCKLLGLEESRINTPRIIVRDRLTFFPKQSVKLHLLYWSIGTGLLMLNSPILEPGAASWMVKGSVIFIFVAPTLISRRVKLNIEHECGYVNILGNGTIHIDQLPYEQFHSYLAHEYAHHLFFYLSEDSQQEPWLKEGWARFFQWQLMKELYNESGNGAYLTHVLEQVVGEIKFACQLLSGVLLTKLPWKVRRISTIYNSNPLWRLFTGSPGFNAKRLIDYSIGTASYFWAERKIGLQEMFKNKLFVDFN